MKRNNPEEFPIWSIRYAPSDVLDLCAMSGKKNADRLAEWLMEWKVFFFFFFFFFFSFFLKEPPEREEYDEDEYFMSEDEYDEDDLCPVGCIIVGSRPGSGKTCLVYGVAKQCGYDVIEINASNYRRGRDIEGFLLFFFSFFFVIFVLLLLIIFANIQICSKKLHRVMESKVKREEEKT